MKEDEDDGLPVLGTTGRYLGARPNFDIPVGADGFVEPGTEGMSVVPPPVENMSRHRRPPEFEGTGKDPIFWIETGGLPDALAYRPDPANPARHGFIEPARRMSFEEYLRALHSTRHLWQDEFERQFMEKLDEVAQELPPEEPPER